MIAASSEDEELSASTSRMTRKRKKDCLKSILGLCQSHLSVESEAEDHYRNVCRALVSEALELSSFLEKTTTYESEHSEELKQLAIKDWVSAAFLRQMSYKRPLVFLRTYVPPTVLVL